MLQLPVYVAKTCLCNKNRGENMAKYTIEIDDEVIEFFRDMIDDSEPVEIMLPKMLKLLQEIIKTANPNN